MDQPDPSRFYDEFWHDLDREELKPLDAYLEKYPGCEAEVRREYDAYEKARSAGGKHSPTRTVPSAPQPGSAPLPETIGPYRILQHLGAGGMGSVYLGEQRGELHRRVAIKVIKPGMDSEQFLKRFAAERQALALMNHPSIARVHDAGTTEDGRPYFVMEYVDGVPLTQYCDENRLSLAGRMELFLQICYGVQHAHQKGIVHRDLKPSNILVTVVDGEAVPRIIDFGLAKAMQSGLGDQTSFLTELGCLVGTPEYMSPEQASLETLDVDAATDVYSLGVILYELLVEALPLERKTLRRAGILEIARYIREQEPPKPSTRLSSNAEAASVARRRSTEIRSLVRCLEGDLDLIVMKALAKDRTCRYLSPSELAADLLRYLQNEVVSVSAPGAWYRVRKLARKHRGLAASVAVAFLSLGIGLIIAVVAWGETAKKEREARELRGQVLSMQGLRTESEAAKKAAEIAKRQAEAEKAEALRRSKDAEARLTSAALKERQAGEAVAAAELKAKNAVEAASKADEVRKQAELDKQSAEMELEGHRKEKQALKVQNEAIARQAIQARKKLTEAQAELDRLQNTHSALYVKNWLEPRLEKLATDAGRLWPLTSRKVAAGVNAWMDQANWLLARGSGGFRVLAPLYGRDASVPELDSLAKNMARLLPTLAKMKARRQILDRVTREHDASAVQWTEARAAIGTSPRYKELKLPPGFGFGLVPLGENSTTHLWEFWHVPSGNRPERNGRGGWKRDPAAGIVLVLLPGSRFMMGARLPEEGKQLTNVDPDASPREGPVHQVLLRPFLLAAHELSVAQWQRLRGITGPQVVGASYHPDASSAPRPVVNVSHDDCVPVLARSGLVLPTEAQWEYACRSGTDTPFAMGKYARSLFERTNLKDIKLPDKLHRGKPGPLPIGCLRPNHFGLHDMHGNVAEWCVDWYGNYERDRIIDPGTGERLVKEDRRGGRVVRGGSHDSPARDARCSFRWKFRPSLARPFLGLRVAYRIER